ncbi:hypothetical protein TpMuguga_02g00254 [Theileria parva strain Muguga]|uniref:uncharacterized protein n=1 Tax=Theileria parva strain Muguga TaxID=333668 RepID=UPI001C61F2D7|nr:uncharacterized protein TpMuguga_02g00254 [Theileria parva strain Muguga]EAN32537.2 hypothetical protein TpMuguga_02g00254 [Theileria parva strain Muguga]
MIKGARLVFKQREDPVKSDPPTTSDLDDLKFESYGHYGPNKVLKIPYPSYMSNGYNFLESKGTLFKRRFLSGVSTCKNISFYKSGNPDFEVSKESIDDLMRMLRFENEPCYQRPYRLIADSKLCIKGNCDTISTILRPGW